MLIQNQYRKVGKSHQKVGAYLPSFGDNFLPGKLRDVLETC